MLLTSPAWLLGSWIRSRPIRRAVSLRIFALEHNVIAPCGQKPRCPLAAVSREYYTESVLQGSEFFFIASPLGDRQIQ